MSTSLVTEVLNEWKSQRSSISALSKGSSITKPALPSPLLEARNRLKVVAELESRPDHKKPSMSVLLVTKSGRVHELISS